MKRLTLIFCFLFILQLSFSQKKDSSLFVGTNIVPTILSTQINLLVEKTINPFFNIHASTGYVIDGPGSYYKRSTDFRLIKSGGFFLSLGINFQTKTLISPLIGIKFINTFSNESWVSSENNIDTMATIEEGSSSLSYSLGTGGVLGLTCNISKRLSFDLGIQCSFLIINGLHDFHSFAPGMGINWNPMRGQFITQIKYKLIK